MYSLPFVLQYSPVQNVISALDRLRQVQADIDKRTLNNILYEVDNSDIYRYFLRPGSSRFL
jgi:hypothetical protein